MPVFWPFQGKNPTPPDWWLDYLRQCKTTPSLQLPPRQHRFVVFDTETTGLQSGKDQLLSIGAFGISQDMLHTADHFSCLVQQQVIPNPQNIAIHGILPQSTREGVPEHLAIQDFVRFCGNAILVGHHVGFDLEYLHHALQKIIPGARIQNKSVDIINLVRKLDRYRDPLYDTAQAYSLEQLCARFEVTTVERHTASGDAWTTAILFLKLLKKIERGGWHKTRHLLYA